MKTYLLSCRVLVGMLAAFGCLGVSPSFAASPNPNPSPSLGASLLEGTPQSPILISETWIESLAADAYSRHQGVQSSLQLLEAAHHERDAVRSWDDPVLELGTSISDPRGPSLREEGNVIYGIQQPLPLFGKPKALRRIAESEIQTATITLDVEKQQILRSLRLIAVSIATRQQQIRITEDEIIQWTTWIANAEQRLANGAGSQAEILRLQNERALRADSLRTEKDFLDHDYLNLNRNLNRPLAGSGSFRPWISLPPITSSTLTNTDWTQIRELQEPQLRILRSMWETSKARTDLTRRQRYPEIAVGVDGRQYSGDGGFREGTLTVALKFPWFNQGRYRSERLREQARETAAQAAVADREWSARELIHHALVDLEAARRRQQLFENEIVPRARQAVEIAHVSWLGGKGMFQELMEVRRSLREAQIEQINAASGYFIQQAELQFLTGSPTPASSPSNPQTPASNPNSKSSLNHHQP